MKTCAATSTLALTHLCVDCHGLRLTCRLWLEWDCLSWLWLLWLLLELISAHLMFAVWIHTLLREINLFFFFLFGLLALCYLFLALAVLSVICRNQFFRSWTGQKVRSTRTWLYCGIGAWADRPNSLWLSIYRCMLHAVFWVWAGNSPAYFVTCTDTSYYGVPMERGTQPDLLERLDSG